ncbi:MAG: hypothetical protein M3044_19785 [Thermoproteota archaeon]|nr:hypothetical protein [Thermoproteota archaeon]
MEHDNNDNNERSDDDSDSQSKSKTRNKFNKCETLDEGTFAFMHWLNSEDKRSLSSTDNPIVLLKFVNDKHTILYDTFLHVETDVQINKGIPYCKYCKEDDCAHVGFAICVEQLYGHRRSGTEERIEDIVEL